MENFIPRLRGDCCFRGKKNKGFIIIESDEISRKYHVPFRMFDLVYEIWSPINLDLTY